MAGVAFNYDCTASVCLITGPSFMKSSCVMTHSIMCEKSYLIFPRELIVRVWTCAKKRSWIVPKSNLVCVGRRVVSHTQTAARRVWICETWREGWGQHEVKLGHTLHIQQSNHSMVVERKSDEEKRQWHLPMTWQMTCTPFIKVLLASVKKMTSLAILFTDRGWGEWKTVLHVYVQHLLLCSLLPYSNFPSSVSVSEDLSSIAQV